MKYPLIAYIILDLKFKYPLIAYIILDLKFKYPLIAYIILDLKFKYPLIAYIILDLKFKYPLIAYIILDLKFKYPLIAYIILGLKKVQNIFKSDNRLGGSTYRIHFVLRSFVDMANSYDRVDLRKLQKKYWQLRTKIYITTQTERKIRDRDQVAVFGGRKKRKGL